MHRSLDQLAEKLKQVNARDPELLRICGSHGLFAWGLDGTLSFNQSKYLQKLRDIEELGNRLLDLEKGFAVFANLLRVVYPLTIFGSQSLKNRYLEECVFGNYVGAHCMTEPMAGSDVGGILSCLKHDRLSGDKTFVTNVSLADIFLVYAKHLPEISNLATQNMSCFILEKDEVDVLEIHSPIIETSWGNIHFDTLVNPTDRMLGKSGAGFRVFAHSMVLERLGLSFLHLGLIKGILREIESAIPKTDLINSDIYLDMQLDALLVESVCEHAATRFGNRKEEMKSASLSKFTSADALVRVSGKAAELMQMRSVTNVAISKLAINSSAALNYSGSQSVLKKNIGTANHGNNKF